MFNIPNLLTIFRLLLIPVFAVIFFSDIPNNFTISIVIFIVAGVTDILDGHIARKYKLITKLGTALDPLADKLMLLTVLACLAIYNYIPVWILIIMACKELFMITFGMLLYKKDTVISANIFGKLSTALFYFSIIMFIFNKTFADTALIIAVISSLIALTNYLLIYNRKKT